MRRGSYTIFFLLLTLFTQQIFTQNCAQGDYAEGGICKPCPPGTYGIRTGGIGISSCQLCPFGTYQNTSSQTTCNNCTRKAICRLGSSKTYPLTYSSEGSPLIVEPIQMNPQAIKLSAIMIIALITIVPLLATAICCFSEELCGLFDVLYSESHYLSEGGIKKKLKSGFGGVMTLLAISLFLIIFSIQVVDLAFDNVITTESLSVNKITTPMPKIGLIKVKVFFNGGAGSCSKNNAIVTVTGYKGNLTSEFVTGTSSLCEFHFNCKDCSFDSRSQSIQVELTTNETFSPVIEYTYDVPEIGSAYNTTFYRVKGFVLPNEVSDSVFYGRESVTDVSFRLFRAVKKGLVGGHLGAPWIQLFSSFAIQTIVYTEGVIQEYITTTKGASVVGSNLPVKPLPGVSFRISTSFSPDVFLIQEALKETLVSFFGISVSLFVACFGFIYFVLIVSEYCKSFFTKLIQIRNKRNAQKEKEESQIQNVEKLVGDVKLSEIELDDVNLKNESKTGKIQDQKQEKQEETDVNDNDIAKKMIVELKQEVQFLSEKLLKMDKVQAVLLKNSGYQEEKISLESSIGKSENTGNLLDLN